MYQEWTFHPVRVPIPISSLQIGDRPSADFIPGIAGPLRPCLSIWSKPVNGLDGTLITERRDGGDGRWEARRTSV